MTQTELKEFLDEKVELYNNPSIFNSIDAVIFIKALKNVYQNHNGLEKVFAKNN